MYEKKKKKNYLEMCFFKSSHSLLNFDPRLISLWILNLVNHYDTIDILECTLVFAL